MWPFFQKKLRKNYCFWTSEITKENVKCFKQRVVSIHEPLGYGPSTLPLRHSAPLNSLNILSLFQSISGASVEAIYLTQYTWNWVKHTPRWRGDNNTLINLKIEQRVISLIWSLDNNSDMQTCHIDRLNLDFPVDPCSIFIQLLPTSGYRHKHISILLKTIIVNDFPSRFLTIYVEQS